MARRRDLVTDAVLPQTAKPKSPIPPATFNLTMLAVGQQLTRRPKARRHPKEDIDRPFEGKTFVDLGSGTGADICLAGILTADSEKEQGLGIQRSQSLPATRAFQVPFAEPSSSQSFPVLRAKPVHSGGEFRHNSPRFPESPWAKSHSNKHQESLHDDIPLPPVSSVPELPQGIHEAPFDASAAASHVSQPPCIVTMRAFLEAQGPEIQRRSSRNLPQILEDHLLEEPLNPPKEIRWGKLRFNQHRKSLHSGREFKRDSPRYPESPWAKRRSKNHQKSSRKDMFIPPVSSTTSSLQGAHKITLNGNDDSNVDCASDPASPSGSVTNEEVFEVIN